MAGGRPSKFTDDIVQRAYFLATKGFTNVEIAKALGVAVDTVYEWLKVHPEFSDALKLGKEEADARVERSLYEKACGYSHPDTHFSSYEGHVTETPTIKFYAPDTTAAIFWLKNRKPAEWRDKQEIETDGKLEIVIKQNW